MIRHEQIDEFTSSIGPLVVRATARPPLPGRADAGRWGLTPTWHLQVRHRRHDPFGPVVYAEIVPPSSSIDEALHRVRVLGRSASAEELRRSGWQLDPARIWFWQRPWTGTRIRRAVLVVACLTWVVGGMVYGCTRSYPTVCADLATGRVCAECQTRDLARLLSDVDPTTAADLRAQCDA